MSRVLCSPALAALAAGLLLVAAPGQLPAGQPGEDSGTRSAVTPDAIVESVMARIDPPAHLAPVFRRNLEETFRAPEIARYIDAAIGQQSAELERLDLAAYEVAVAEIAASAATDKVVAGMRRLPPDQLLQFYLITPQLLAAMPTEVCADIADSRLTAAEMQDAEIEALKVTPAEQVDAYLTLYRNAFIAELRNDPPASTLPMIDRRMADMVYEQAVMNEIERHPRSSAIMAAIGNSEAPDADRCDFARTAWIGIASIEGDVGDMIRRYVLE